MKPILNIDLNKRYIYCGKLSLLQSISISRDYIWSNYNCVKCGIFSEKEGLILFQEVNNDEEI